MERAIDRLQLGAFAFLGLTTIVSVLVAIQTQLYYIALAPIALMVIYTAIINFKLMFYFLLVAIPFSIEYSFSPSLGTDLPDEPLMVGLMLVTIVFIFVNYKSLPTGYFTNIVIVGLTCYVFWILITALVSTNFLVSFKVFLAKLWYVITFALLSAIVLRTKDDFKKVFWCIYIPLTLLIIQVLVRQALQGFTFEDVNKPMYPFFRNHVNYAAIMSVFFPFILRARTWYKKWTYPRVLLNFSLLLYAVAIYLSFTRTAYLAILLIFPFYLVVRFRLMKYVLATIAVAVTVFVVYMLHNNRYLDYAPDYRETIYHEDFGKHLSSTFEGKDVSSMERIYRWVAVVRMFRVHPWMGFGPGNFYPNYMKYTVTSFQTYVSDNPEHSTAHNYMLLLLAEQGAIGLGIFIFLTGAIFIYGERVYHRIQDKDYKDMALTFLLMLFMIYVNIVLSDLLESDKVGPFFFMSLSMLAALGIRYGGSSTQNTD